MRARPAAATRARSASKISASRCQDPLVRLQHLLLVLLELRGDEALAAGDRLLADVVGGHERQVRLADLDVVAEDAVEADLERRDAGARALALLDGGDRRAPAAADLAQLVELGVDAVADDAALAQAGAAARPRASRSMSVGDVERRIEVLELARARAGAMALDERLARPRAARAASAASATQVARAGGAQRDAAQDAVEVLDAAERLAQAAALDGAEGQLLDGVEPVLDRLQLDQRAQRSSRAAGARPWRCACGRARRAACRGALPSARLSTSSRLRRVSASMTRTSPACARAQRR